MARNTIESPRRDEFDDAFAACGSLSRERDYLTPPERAQRKITLDPGNDID